jgi:glyoxylase-like metal-dependent hydrolase (beta-lactamase superfamily II)
MAQTANSHTPPAAAQQPNFSNVEIKVTKVADTVYMLEGMGGNIAVSVGDDGIFMVDDQFAPMAPKIKAALKGISDKPVRFLLNTHYHGDHVGGNAEFGPAALIIAQDNVRKRLEEGTIGWNGNKVPPTPKEGLPVLTFNDRLTLHLNGEDIRITHIPNAHTDGDSVVFFPQANVVHMGDLFVTYGFPIVDVNNGGHVSGMIAGIEQFFSALPADVKVIPGHGPLCNVEDVRKFVAMMKETRALVAQAAQQGKTPEQMKQAHLLAKYEDLGKGMIKADQWIDLLYAEVTEKTGSARQ